MLKIRRSGGPKTAQGKKIASQNALKTGAFCATVVLPNESEAEFKELADQFFRDFLPRDAVEASMVRKMAVLEWKQRRLERLESAGHVRVLDRPIEAHELDGVGVYLPEGCEHIVANLSMLTPELVAEQAEIRKSILELQSVALTEQVIKGIPSKHRAFYRAMCLLAHRYWDLRETDLAVANLARHRIREGTPDEERFLIVALRELLDSAKRVRAVHDQLDAIRSAIPKIKDRRLLVHVQSDGVDRAHDYLSRAFSRTAAEWRRHRKWRQDNATYDVTPNPDGSITI
jgi:hypothetical protein